MKKISKLPGGEGGSNLIKTIEIRLAYLEKLVWDESTISTEISRNANLLVDTSRFVYGFEAIKPEHSSIEYDEEGAARLLELWNYDWGSLE